MWNIIKAQNYQTKGENSVIIGFILCMLFPFLAQFSNESGLEGLTGSIYMVNYISFLPVVLVIVSLFVVTKICGFDMNDKTINYEILSGHSRAEVYFGRVIVSFIWGILGAVIVTLGPILIITAIKGWGNNLIFKDAMVRYLVIMVIYIRWISEVCLLTFVVKNSTAAGVLGYALFDAGMIFGLIINQFYENDFIDYVFTSINMTLIGAFDNSKSVLIDGETVQLYEAFVDTTTRNNSILVSISFSIVCIILGYVIFNKRDLK